MQLNVTKRIMWNLIRKHKDQIGDVIPQPSCKELSFRKREDGSYELSWKKWEQSFRFILTNSKALPLLLVEIFRQDLLEFREIIPLNRDFLREANILVDGEEEH